MLVNLHWLVPFNAAAFHFHSCCPAFDSAAACQLQAALQDGGISFSSSSSPDDFPAHPLATQITSRDFSIRFPSTSSTTFAICCSDGSGTCDYRPPQNLIFSFYFFIFFPKKTCVCCSRTFFGNNFSFLVLNAKESDRMYNFLQFSFTQIICHFLN